MAKSDKNSILNGIYFESVLIIDLINSDSIFQTKECHLNLKKNHSEKSISYELHPTSGKKEYWINSKNDVLDTSVIEQWARIIPKFNTLLEYDLADINEFKVDFKNKEVNRENGTIDVLDKKLLSNEKIEINFLNDTLTSWSTANMSECTNDGKIPMCFEITSKRKEFSHNENGYYLKNCYLYGVIHIKVNDQQFIIKLKKGFIENPNELEAKTIPFKNVEEYFNTVNYSNSSELVNFYIFPK